MAEIGWLRTPTSEVDAPKQRTPCTVTVAETQCVSFSDSIDGIDKNHAVEKSLNSLHEQIEKLKADNGVTCPVTVSA